MDVSKLKNHPHLRGYKVEDPRKRNPLLIVMGVDSSLKEEEVKDAIMAQNLQWVDLTKLKLPFKTGRREQGIVHWVVETYTKAWEGETLIRVLLTQSAGLPTDRAVPYISASISGT